MLKNVRYAKCIKCGKEYEATPNTTTCECGGILDIVYNYNYIKSTFNKGVLSQPGALHVALPASSACGAHLSPHPPAGGLVPPSIRRTIWPKSWASRPCISRMTVRTPPPP